MPRARIVASVLERSTAAAQRRIDVLRRHRIEIELDLMDGRFVPTRSFGPDGIATLRVPSRTTAHLMVDEPIPWINACLAIGIRRFVLHVESPGISPHAVRNISGSLDISIAINPTTPLHFLAPYVDFTKGVQVMTIKPGRQGNPFLPSQLTVIRRLKRLYPRVFVSADGSMNEATIPLAVSAGARRIIVGSALKKTRDIGQRYRQLTRFAR